MSGLVDECPVCSCPEEGVWVLHGRKPCPRGESDVVRLRRLLARCIPAVRDAEHLAKEVMCAEGVVLYRTLLNDIEQEVA